MVGSLRATGAAAFMFVALTASSPAEPPRPDLPLLAPPTPIVTVVAPLPPAPPIAAVVDDVNASELDCLAVAVYHEARGEPVAGQRAVAQVLVNRVRSGRFARTLCGVLRQPGQFPFRAKAASARNARQWGQALRVARAVMTGAEQGHPRALFFHATHVNPGWSRTQVAAIGNHVFYR